MKRLLYFSRRERAGVAGLVLLALALHLAASMLERRASPAPLLEEDWQIARTLSKPAPKDSAEKSVARLFYFNPNTATKDDVLALGFPEKAASNLLKYREKGGTFRKTADLAKLYGLPEDVFRKVAPYIRLDKPGEKSRVVEVGTEATYFHFDPNAISQTELEKLGVPHGLATRWVRYREKGGFFKKETDLKRLYGMDSLLYERLRSWMQWPAVETATPVFKKKTAEPEVLDINAAGEAEWDRLPGIGQARARQIVRYRDKLGGFVRIEQVAEVYGLPDSVFRLFKPILLLGDPALKKLNINTAGLETLKAHPYIGSREAGILLAYRLQHGAFQNVDQLSRVKGLDNNGWLEKIRPYLTVQ